MLTSSQINAGYVRALRLVSSGQDARAVTILRGLGVLAPNDIKIWRLTGIALQRQAKLDEAYVAYRDGLVVDGSDVACRVLAAECAINLHLDIHAARCALEAVARETNVNPENGEYVLRARSLLTYMQAARGKQ
jgi:hypothetical protein